MRPVVRSVVAVQRRFVPTAVRPRAFGVVSRSTSIVGEGCPSFGGQRTVSCRSRSGVLCVGQVLQPTRGPPRSEWAACPSAVSARSCRAQAPCSTVRCSGARTFSAKRGRSQSRSLARPLASGRAPFHSSIKAGTLTVMNAIRAKRGSSIGSGARARSSGTALQLQAPNHSVKRTAPGVPGSAAYLKR